jgi:hypothetical protein
VFLLQNERIALGRVFRCDVSGPVTGSEQQRLKAGSMWGGKIYAFSQTGLRKSGPCGAV